MDVFSHPSFHPKSSSVRPPIHNHRPFPNGEVMNDHSVFSRVSPQTAPPKPHLQMFPAASAPTSFNPYFTDSPYSSGSSSSFPNESPPAEPIDMEPDFTHIVSSPDDLRYSYPAMDQGDPSEWAATGLPGMPYSAEVYAQQPLATPISAPATMPVSWPPAPKKLQAQQYQQQQMRPVDYPSFSGQAGRIRSQSDGTPSGPGSSANGMNSFYAHHRYAGQSAEDLDLVYPQDTDFHTMGNGPSGHSHSPFPTMRPHSQEQQQYQRSVQPPRVKREQGRSMSDAAAAPPMRPPMYTSTSQPGTFGPFGLTMHTTSTHTTTVHSSGQVIQSHAGYPPQHQGGAQHNMTISMPMSSTPLPMYGSPPTYTFNELASNSNNGYSPGGRLDQNAQIMEELSPMVRFQTENQGGQGGCDPRYMNGNISGGTSSDGGVQGDDTTKGRGVVKEEGGEENRHVATHLGGQMDEAMDSVLLDADADEDADGDDEHDADYQTGDDDDLDDDGDGEYVVRSRRGSTSTNAHSLRPRRRSSTTTRYQPYSFSIDDSTSPSSSKPIHIPSSQPTTSRSRPRVRSRQAAPLPIPVPVPNLTKKSRGRRVPTVDSLVTSVGKSIKGAPQKDGDERESRFVRTYTCDAAGCGKCFARGEHLKRHVRSIHTYEKPHRCPFPSCDKDFSRHDNLRQHLRVHKGFQPPKDESHETGETW